MPARRSGDAAPGPRPAPSAAALALHCGHWFDAKAGKRLGAATVVVQGERIGEIEPGRIEVLGATAIGLGQPGGAIPHMTLAQIKAVADAAREYGLTVGAHAHDPESIRRAVLGGIDSIEHGTFIDAASAELMKRHGTWFVPTICVGKIVAENADEWGSESPQEAIRCRTSRRCARSSS